MRLTPRDHRPQERALKLQMASERVSRGDCPALRRHQTLRMMVV